MNHKSYLIRLIFLALGCALIGYSYGYFKGVEHAKDFVMERIK